MWPGERGITRVVPRSHLTGMEEGTMDMRELVSPREIVTEPPNDAEHPRMYEWTVYLLGGIVALCVIGLFALAMFQRGNDAVTTGLISIALLCGGGLVNLLKREA